MVANLLSKNPDKRMDIDQIIDYIQTNMIYKPDTDEFSRDSIKIEPTSDSFAGKLDKRLVNFIQDSNDPNSKEILRLKHETEEIKKITDSIIWNGFEETKDTNNSKKQSTGSKSYIEYRQRLVKQKQQNRNMLK